MPNGLELAKAFFSLEADDSKLDAQLKGAEGKVEQSTKRIADKVTIASVAIGSAIGNILGGYVSKLIGELSKIPEFFLDSVKTTATFGLEMEHLGARMGMTAQQAAVLNGMMERQGLSTNVAARAMQILAMETKQTQDAIDPFHTKMGRLLGTLRDNNGATLNMSQVLDLARDKIRGAGNETERLQIAQQLFGTRMGGQLIPLMKLSNDEWAKQSAEISKSLGPVDKAADAALEYKAALAGLQQNLRGVQLEMGTAVLPTLSRWITEMSGGLTVIRDMVKESPALQNVGKALYAATPQELFGKATEGVTSTWLSIGEKVGVYSKGAADNFNHMKDYMAQSLNAANELEKKKIHEKELQDSINQGLQESDQREAQAVAIAGKKVEISEKLLSLGKASSSDVEVSIQQKLLALETQRAQLEEHLNQPGLEDDQRMKLQEELLNNELQGIDVISKATKERYAQEELQIKAKGALNDTTEIAFLQKQLQDSNIVGDDRLKLEAEIFEKRKQYEEKAISLARQLGFASVQDEIKFRESKTQELVGKGDFLGAAGEVKKIQDLRLREGDSAMEFLKKTRVVSLQDEIEYQKQKLEIVKGNADEERKVLESIADLDKQLYDQRLSFAMNYTKNIQGQFKALEDAQQGGGDVESFDQAKREANRNLVQATRDASGVLHGGGTEQQRDTSLQFADFVMKNVETMQQQGEKITEEWQNAISVAKDILNAAGVKQVKEPGGPSPTVASLLSPAEGLATSGLARGSEIPRLDTSFSDLAIRVRDVFLGVIPNIQNFSDAILSATRKVLGTSGPQINSPTVGLGPGGGAQDLNSPLPTGPTSPAQPGFGTATVGGRTINVGGGSTDLAAAASALRDNSQSQADVIAKLQDVVDSQKSVADRLSSATDALAAASAKGAQVQVGVDPNNGDLKALVVNTLEEALS